MDEIKENDISQKKLRKREKKEKKAYRKANGIPTIWYYMKDHKGYIFAYIFLSLVVVGLNVYSTVLSA